MRTGQVPVLPKTTPWVGMGPAQIRDFVEGLGSLEAAADYILARGHTLAYEKNRDFRETGLQGRAIDEDRDDLSGGLRPIETKRRGGIARGVDIDQWNAVLALYPPDGPHRDVLISSARHGCGGVNEIAEEVGRTPRRVRQIQDQIWAWATKHLNPVDLAARLDDPITRETAARRPPSRAGRKPKGWVSAQAAQAQRPQVDIFGEVVEWAPRKPRRKAATGMRRVRPVPVVQGGQMELFQEAA